MLGNKESIVVVCLKLLSVLFVHGNFVNIPSLHSKSSGSTAIYILFFFTSHTLHRIFSKRFVCPGSIALFTFYTILKSAVTKSLHERIIGTLVDHLLGVKLLTLAVHSFIS